MVMERYAVGWRGFCSHDKQLTTITGKHAETLGTVRAHDKDINTIDVSPNSKLIATGSQDKTIKVHHFIVTFPRRFIAYTLFSVVVIREFTT